MNSIAKLSGHCLGKDCYIVGTGTSLRDFDWSLLEDKITIALNDAIRAFPATFHFYTDNLADRYEKLDRRRTHVVFKKIYRTAPKPSGVRSAFYFEHKTRPEVCNDHQLYVFATVAASAIHFAQRMKAKRIFLLGVDGYRLESGVRYFDGRHRSNRKPYKAVHQVDDRVMEKQHRRWIKAMEVMREFFRKRGLYQRCWPNEGVYNLNIKSCIHTWQKIPLEKVMRKISSSELPTCRG